MDNAAQTEYARMLDRLGPLQAVAKFNERIKRIGKVNTEIADWLQERRKIEDAYASGLKKLSKRLLPDSGEELGTFDKAWKSIVACTINDAASHATFSQYLEKDVEAPLRSFATTNTDMIGMPLIQGNLTSMAKELEDATKQSEKIASKGGKASTQKAEAAANRLIAAESQWQAQAPYIYESLQSLDEKRLNYLRDALVQYTTLEMDNVDRTRLGVASCLETLLEVDTKAEIASWSQATVSGNPITERKARQLSSTGTQGNDNLRPPTQATNRPDDDMTSQYSGSKQSSAAANMKSKFGTMFGAANNRRRQSVVGGFGLGRASSPSKGFAAIGRNTASREGRPGVSPRTSTNDVDESSSSRDNRLSPLPETPSQANGSSNGFNHGPSNFPETAIQPGPSEEQQTPNLSQDQFPGPAPARLLSESQTDDEGFTVPAPMNDPISQAQQEAQNLDRQQAFDLAIRNEPIPEDADAAAALSNVTNTLRSGQSKTGTVRGRRDGRNSVYVPAGNTMPGFDHNAPVSPSLPTAGSGGRAATLAALSEHSKATRSASDANSVLSSQSTMQQQAPSSPGLPTAGSGSRAATLAAFPDHGFGPRSASDANSIRSGHSVSQNAAVHHADLREPGLNASIIEMISASFVDGTATDVKISGEVFLKLNSSAVEDSNTTCGVRFNDISNLEAIGPNRMFVNPAAEDKPEEFIIDMAQIQHKGQVGFTYRAQLDQSQFALEVPIVINAVWRSANDKLQLLVNYTLNPALSFDSLSLSNVYIIAHYEGPHAVGVKGKPMPVHSSRSNTAIWRLDDLLLTKGVTQKVIAQFPGPSGTLLKSGIVEVKWEIKNASTLYSPFGSGASLSRAGLPATDPDRDPFADENWVPIQTTKRIVAGKYEAQPNTDS